jgi:hypothetical protein
LGLLLEAFALKDYFCGPIVRFSLEDFFAFGTQRLIVLLGSVYSLPWQHAVNNFVVRYERPSHISDPRIDVNDVRPAIKEAEYFRHRLVKKVYRPVLQGRFVCGEIEFATLNQSRAS